MRICNTACIRRTARCLVSFLVLVLSNLASASESEQGDFRDLSHSVQLQISDLECEVQFNPFSQTCETLWRTITSHRTGKDHMHEYVVLQVDRDALVGRDWQLTANYMSMDPHDGIDQVLRFDAGTSPGEWSEQLLGAANAFVMGWNLELEAVAEKIAELRSENRYLIGYYPTMAINATFQLKLEESDRQLGLIEVSYPGS